MCGTSTRTFATVTAPRGNLEDRAPGCCGVLRPGLDCGPRERAAHIRRRDRRASRIVMRFPNPDLLVHIAIADAYACAMEANHPPSVGETDAQ